MDRAKVALTEKPTSVLPQTLSRGRPSHHHDMRIPDRRIFGDFVVCDCETACADYVRTSSACTLREYMRRSRNAMNVWRSRSPLCAQNY